MKFDFRNIPDHYKFEVTKTFLVKFANDLLSRKVLMLESDLEEFMDIDKTTKYLKLARQTIYQLTSNRDIPFYKKNKKLYFKKSELVAWLKEGKSISKPQK